MYLMLSGYIRDQLEASSNSDSKALLSIRRAQRHLYQTRLYANFFIICCLVIVRCLTVSLELQNLVEKKEDKPVDMSRITEHMSRLDQREERIQKKIQDLDTQLEQYVFLLHISYRIKQKLATASGSTYQSLRVQASNVDYSLFT